MPQKIVTNPVVAILCSDLHLSHVPPIARFGEKNWYEAMLRPIRQLKKLADKYSVPVICAGDVFDYWKAPPELINFAIENLPDMYAIPGQHDLPFHNIDEIQRSAFYTLVKAGKIRQLKPDIGTMIDGGIIAFGFPWETEIIPHPNKANILYLAVAHKYIWRPYSKYPGAPLESRINTKNFGSALKGYGAAVFGDNHKGFLYRIGKCNILNCGGFMKRNSDESEYQPCVGLLKRDGEIKRCRLNTKRDIIAKTAEVDRIEHNTDFSNFIAELGMIKDSRLDFSKMMRKIIYEHRPTSEVKKLLLKAIDYGNHKAKNNSNSSK